MSLEQKLRFSTTWIAGGERRDLGNGKERQDGETTVPATKDRPGAGEKQIVHTGYSEEGNMTLVYDYDRIRPNEKWMRDTIETAEASLTGQILRGNVPVENTEVHAAVPVKIGRPKADANGDGVTTIEIEFMIGVRA